MASVIRLPFARFDNPLRKLHNGSNTKPLGGTHARNHREEHPR